MQFVLGATRQLQTTMEGVVTGAVLLAQYGWCNRIVHLCVCVVQSHGRPGTDATGAEKRWSHPPGPLRTILWRPGESSQ